MSARWPRAVWACAASLSVLIMSGCHGGAQTDIVEREMRWQEDQIYAMEDYLTEYQQLLCQYRAENSALKRQIARGNRQSQSGPTLQGRPDSRVRRDERAIQDTEEIMRELTPPDVPPLMETMPGGEAPPAGGANPPGPSLNFRPIRRQAPELVVEQSVDAEQAEPDTLSAEQSEDALPIELEETLAVEAGPEPQVLEENFAENQPVGTLEPIGFVVVSGDVLPAEEGGGPRLLVSVEPLGTSGFPAAFDGELSLMILDVSAETPQGVARWDFSSEHLAEVLAGGVGQSMQFPLQLPPETPTDRQLEIWARLLPADGEKVLAHAELNLAEPCAFSSERPELVALEEPAAEEEFTDSITAGSEQPLVVAETDNLSVGEWDGWQVARPGEHKTAANSQQQASTWRKATQPLPTKLNHGRPVVATSDDLNAGDSERVASRDKRGNVEPPSWSPDRDNSAVEPASKLAPRAWSPER